MRGCLHSSIALRPAAVILTRTISIAFPPAIITSRSVAASLRRIRLESTPRLKPWRRGASQATAAAKAHAVEVEAAPIMYVAQLLGSTTEQAIRWLILAMVLCCDPLAIALTAAASARR